MLQPQRPISSSWIILSLLSICIETHLSRMSFPSFLCCVTPPHTLGVSWALPLLNLSMHTNHGRWNLAIYILANSHVMLMLASPRVTGVASQRGLVSSGVLSLGSTWWTYKYIPSPQRRHISPMKSEVLRVGFRRQSVFKSPSDSNVQAGWEPVESPESLPTQEAITGMARPFHTECPWHRLGLAWALLSGHRSVAQWLWSQTLEMTDVGSHPTVLLNFGWVALPPSASISSLKWKSLYLTVWPI